LKKEYDVKNIVLSGFGVFGTYPVNPTKIVAQQLHGRTVSGFKIYSRVFSAAIPRGNLGRNLLGMARDLNASGVISLGMDSGKIGICVESAAVNRFFNEKYLPSYLNGTAITNRYPQEQRFGLDLKPWQIPLFQCYCHHSGIPIMDISMDAGGFCCNHLMYQVRLTQLTYGLYSQIPFIFIHIPCSPEAILDPHAFAKLGKVMIPIEQVMNAVELLLACAVL